MTRNADANAMSDKGPCMGCENLRACGNMKQPLACVAYEKFDAGESKRAWRDAPREPSPLIARRLLVAAHGKEWVERNYPVQKPKLSRSEVMLGIIAAADDPGELRRLARQMRDDGYSPIDVALLMRVSLVEARELMGYEASV